MAEPPLSFSTVRRGQGGTIWARRRRKAGPRGHPQSAGAIQIANLPHKCWNGGREASRLSRLGSREQARDARFKRLARSIDALAEKDESFLRHASEIATLRRTAAVGLHSICFGFVDTVNRLLSRSEMVLDPPEFSPDAFQEDAKNLFQINVQGRILQIEFETPPELISTEDLRIPYTLHGVVRAFNQELLDRSLIEEQLLFYTLEKDKKMWRYFDARTYHSGPFDQEYLMSLMEQLI